MKIVGKAMMCVLVAAVFVMPIGMLNADTSNCKNIHYTPTNNILEGSVHNGHHTYKTGCIEEEITEAKVLTGETPPSWDWREQHIMTRVKNQGNCGSCVAFAAAGAFEAIIQKKDETPIDLSEAHMYFCSDRSCDPDSSSYGWWISQALDFMKNPGICTESCFPYDGALYGSTLPCSPCDQWRQQAYKISEWRWIEDTVSMKNALIEYGPLIANFYTYNDFHDYWHKYPKYGTIYYHGGEGEHSSHAVVIVGYNDDPGYWICKNSWGTQGGDNGYFYIGYGECMIDDQAAYMKYKTPVADAGHPADCCIYEHVNFDGSDSYHPYGNIVSYTWDFGDGTTTTGPQPTHQYTCGGHYRVTLTVKDNHGEIDTDSVEISVADDNIELGGPVGGFGVTMFIRNTGEQEVCEVPWNIRFTDSVFVNNESSDIISNIPPGETITTKSGFLLGLGPATLRVNVGNMTISEKCYVIGPLVIKTT